MPKLSIIIPTFNSEGTIQRCLDSIQVQTFTDYEVVFQDGGSSDRTVQLIQAFERSNPEVAVKFKQARDKGPYDAMNLAIPRASGEWLYFLGSDDELLDRDVLGKMLCSREASESDVLYGSVLVLGMGGWVPDGTIYNGPFDLNKLLTMNICHQAIFYRAAFAREVGGYNIKYVLLADWDFNLRCWAKGTFSHVDVVVAKYHLGGISNKSLHDRKFENKMTANVIRYFGLSPADPLVTSPTFYGRKADDARRARRITPKRVFRALSRKLGLIR